MLGSAAFRTGVAPGGALAPGWVKNELWRKARTVPSLDLRFADNKSLVDATTGASLVTFTRASSGTFVGSDGVLRTAVTNLLLRSEEFDDASWGKSATSITANNAIAPNGASTADALISNTTTTFHFCNQGFTLVNGTTYTFSIYLKAAGYNFVLLNTSLGSASGNAGPIINLSNGTKAGFFTVDYPTLIQSVGNGWYRVSYQYTSSGTFGVIDINTLPTSSISAYAGDGTSGIYAWGAQLEQSATVGEYIPTTSVINSAPRFDHNPTTGESLGLLVEEARTNSIRNNTMVGAVAGTPGTLPTNWFTFTALTGLTQSIVGTGTENGITYIDVRLNGTPSGAGQWQISAESTTSVVASNAQSWTFSSYYKLAAGSLSGISMTQFSVNEYTAIGAYLDGTFVTAAAPSSVMQRASASRTFTNALTARVFAPIFLNLTGTAVDITLRIGLPQLEQGAFATSPILTSTAAATRSADVASIGSSAFTSFYNQSEGTMFADYKVASSSGNLIGSSDGTNNNRIFLGIASGPLARLLVTTSGSAVASIGVAYALNSAAKTAGVYSTNYFQSATAGVLGTEDVLGGVPTVDRLAIGTNTTQSDFFANGTIKRLCYWRQALPGSTLQAITG